MITHDTSSNISDSLFLDYLRCKYKAFLKLSGKSGVKSDFQKFQDENHAEYCLRARECLLTTGDITARSTVSSSFKKIKKQEISVAFGISISNDKYSLILDAAELSSQSSPRKAVYNPIIFLPHQKISKQDKLFLAFYGSALGREQKRDPASGRIIYGDRFSSTKMQLNSLITTVGKIEKEITNMIDKQTAPPLRLNDHCKICEFQVLCLAAAKGKDDLSLLKGLSGKEIDTLNKRGIFTVTQYSYTFRPRRAKKMMSKQIIKHHHSLNALAIRTQTIYIARKPELPYAATRVYLDVEGIIDENFYYLIGLVIDDGANFTSHSFWASNKTEEKVIWSLFLEKMIALKDFVLLHYGNYETKFLKQMSEQYGGNSELLEKIKSCSFNVLSAIYGCIYFPTYSNDLKSIASFLGFTWSEHNASGLMSLLWRQQWEATRKIIYKQKLLTYNHEDCQALRTVTDYLGGKSTTKNFEKYPSKHTDQIKRDKPYDIFRENNFCFPELEKINRCAYFDYQRDKVYARISSRELWSYLLNGTLLHVDETKVSVRGVTNYVWAFANMDTIYYMHTNTREGDFLKEKLNGFKGILVSDFYTAYDSIPCVQQKCLIHLIRDMNEDILKCPFDWEMKELGKDFTALLTPIIETIDKYGLKKRHLHLHGKAVLRFFKKLEDREYSSELAKNFQRRMVKYKDKLFSFLVYDGIPWNNNNAEHAIKRFVFLRNVINGLSTEESINEYMVLLSICETLRLHNKSFLNFLSSKASDMIRYKIAANMVLP